MTIWFFLLPENDKFCIFRALFKSMISKQKLYYESDFEINKIQRVRFWFQKKKTKRVGLWVYRSTTRQILNLKKNNGSDFDFKKYNRSALEFAETQRVRFLI